MIKIISGKKYVLPEKYFNGLIKLRYLVYLDSGFIKKNKEKTYTDAYDNEADHFIAINEDKVIGGLSIIYNNLPLEIIFKDEKEELIKKFKSRRVIELSRFVIEKKFRINKNVVKNYNNFLSFKLFKKAYKMILKNRINLVLICVHPKYKERYEKYYGFKQYGKVKSYPKVENNPGLLMYQTKGMIYRLLLKNITKSFWFVVDSEKFFQKNF